MMLSVTFIDFLIVLIIVVSAGYAAWRGFISETLTIFEWVAAALACLYIGPYLIPMMRSLFSQPWLASLLAYASVFLAVFIPLAFLSHRISQGVKNSPIGPLGPGRRRGLRHLARVGDRGIGLSGVYLFRPDPRASALADPCGIAAHGAEHIRSDPVGCSRSADGLCLHPLAPGKSCGKRRGIAHSLSRPAMTPWQS